MYITVQITRSLFYFLTTLNLLKDLKEERQPIWLYLICFLDMLAHLHTMPDEKFDKIPKCPTWNCYKEAGLNSTTLLATNF